MTRGTWHPYDELVRDRDEASRSAQPTMLERRPANRRERRLNLSLTPGSAFAAAALAVSIVALAFTLGRRQPLESPTPPASNATSTDVLRQHAVDYAQLEVDRGRAD